MYSNSNEPQLTVGRGRVAGLADASAQAGVEPTTPPLVVASIKGYRQLNPGEQDFINEIKAHAEATGLLVTKVQHYVSENGPDDLPTALNPNRWAALAQTDLQMGFMKLIRAVAQPTSF
jgi:hypothetical protein